MAGNTKHGGAVYASFLDVFTGEVDNQQTGRDDHVARSNFARDGHKETTDMSCKF